MELAKQVLSNYLTKRLLANPENAYRHIN